MKIAPDLEHLAVDVASLSEMDHNPRKHNEKNIEAIVASLREFGQRKPIVVRGGRVIAGNGTLEAARRIGAEKIAVANADDLTDEQAKLFAVADNRTHDLSAFDTNVLKNILAPLDPARAMSAGFKAEDLSSLFGGVSGQARHAGRATGPAEGVSWDDVDGSAPPSDDDEDGEEDTLPGESAPPASDRPSSTDMAPDPSSGYSTIILTADDETIRNLRRNLNRLKTEWDVTTLTDVIVRLVENQHESDA